MFGTSLQHRRTKERRELFLCILRFSTLSCDISGFSDYEVDIPEKLVRTRISEIESREHENACSKTYD